MALAEQMIEATAGATTDGSSAFPHDRSPYFPSHSAVDQFDEWEVDELLGWTNALNFDE